MIPIKSTIVFFCDHCPPSLVIGWEAGRYVGQCGHSHAANYRNGLTHDEKIAIMAEAKKTGIIREASIDELGDILKENFA